MNKTLYIGEIMLGNKVIMSDPCYDIDGGVLVTDIEPGKYFCFVRKDDNYNRNAYVVAVHEHFYRPNMKDIWVTPADVVEASGKRGIRCENGCDIGVDSGQAGIYDYDEFINHEKERDYNNTEHWYRQVCETTDGKDRAGIIHGKGVTSSSGWGDGCYYSYILSLYNPLSKRNQKFAFLIDFMMYDEEDEEEDEFDEEDED